MLAGGSAETLHRDRRDVSDGARADGLIVRLATQADLDRYFGGRRRPTMRAFIAELKGEIVGVMGLTHEHVPRLVSELAPALTPYLRSVAVGRAIVKMMRMARGEVYAMAEHETGAKLLRRLGFRDEGGYFVWRG